MNILSTPPSLILKKDGYEVTKRRLVRITIRHRMEQTDICLQVTGEEPKTYTLGPNDILTLDGLAATLFDPRTQE